MASNGKTAWRLGAIALALAVLSACGNGDPVTEPPHPVIVVRADGAAAQGEARGGQADGGVLAFAGEVRAREETALAFRVGGKLVRRQVDVGDRVRAGEVLAELDPGDLQLQVQSLQAQLEAAEAQLARARADHARVAALAGDQLVSRSALDQQTATLRAAEGQVRAARAQRDLARSQSGYTALRAPRDGAISGRQAEIGQVVAAGQPVFSLAADGGREVAFALPETDIRAFRVGQPVVIEPWSTPGLRLPGRIREIAPAADPQARTYAARASLDEEVAQRVDLGQSARVLIPRAGEAGAIRVPLTALQRGARGEPVVWVIDAVPAGAKPAKARRVPVRIGPFAADGVPVLSGLKPTDWVVLAGGHLLHEGQTVLPVDRSNRPVASN
jgi:multidrug efflux system membrane fusion protein